MGKPESSRKRQEPGKLAGHEREESMQGEVRAKALLALEVRSLHFILRASWNVGIFRTRPSESPRTAFPLKNGDEMGSW